MARTKTQVVITWDYIEKWEYQDRHKCEMGCSPDAIFSQIKSKLEFCDRILNQNADMSKRNPNKMPDEWKQDALVVLAQANELVKMLQIKRG